MPIFENLPAIGAFPIAIIVVVVLVLWGIRVQNKLVSIDELCSNSMSQIGVQQATRWDALTAIADLIKGYSDHEYNTLADVIKQRRGISGSSTAEEANMQDGFMGQLLGRIAVLSEAYPDLKANAIYKDGMESVRLYEENVRMSRMVYNDTVTKFNRLIRAFPGSVVAWILRFAVRGYLQDDPTKSSMPSMAR